MISAPLYAAERLPPGQWEFSLTTDGASHTSAHCVTPAEAGQVNGDVATARAATEKKAAGHGDMSEGTLTTTVQGAKPAVTQVKARRLGACTPASRGSRLRAPPSRRRAP